MKIRHFILFLFLVPQGLLASTEEERSVAVIKALEDSFQALERLKVEQKHRMKMPGVSKRERSQRDQKEIEGLIANSNAILRKLIEGGGRTDLVRNPVSVPEAQKEYGFGVTGAPRTAYSLASNSPFNPPFIDYSILHPLDIALRKAYAKYSVTHLAKPFGWTLDTAQFWWEPIFLIAQAAYAPRHVYWKDKFQGASRIVFLIAYATTNDGLWMPGFHKARKSLQATSAKWCDRPFLEVVFKETAEELRQACGDSGAIRCSDERVKEAIVKYAEILRKEDISVKHFKDKMLTLL